MGLSDQGRPGRRETLDCAGEGPGGWVMDTGRPGCPPAVSLSPSLCRPCCPWAVCASSRTAASTRRPTAATSWGSAPTCRSPPTCSPQVRLSSPRPSTQRLALAVRLRVSPAGLGSRDPHCRTSFPSVTGPLVSAFKTEEDWTDSFVARGLTGMALGWGRPRSGSGNQ